MHRDFGVGPNHFKIKTMSTRAPRGLPLYAFMAINRRYFREFLDCDVGAMHKIHNDMSSSCEMWRPTFKLQSMIILLLGESRSAQ